MTAKSKKPALAIVVGQPTNPAPHTNPVEDTINQFMAMTRLHGLDNVVLVGTGPNGNFQYLYQAPNPLGLVGVMERVKADLIDRSRA